MGVNGIKAFWLFDTKGRYVPTRHPHLFETLVKTKKSVNWYIKEYGDGFFDMLEPISYYLNRFVRPPDWIETALKNAIAHQIKANPNKMKEVFQFFYSNLWVIRQIVPPVIHSRLVYIKSPILTMVNDIPSFNAYCVRCCTKSNATSGCKHIAKSSAHSWHYYCSKCGLQYMDTTPYSRRQKYTQKQIISWIQCQRLSEINNLHNKEINLNENYSFNSR